MRTLRLEAPAKVNLGLRVRGRRADGYHELESVFVPLRWGDTVELALAPSGADVGLTLAGASQGVPAGEENLAVRAARAFLRGAGASAGLRIALTKRIPAAAGLGGGSSDAGAVLRGLAALWPGAFTPAALGSLALELGADVPFFLDPRPARVTGIGERITPLPDVPTLPLVLAHPGVPLSTAAVFAAYEAAEPSLTPAGAAPTIRDPGAPACAAGPEAERPDGLGGWLRAMREGLLENDLEPAALRLCPVVAELRVALEEGGAEAVGLSGSGPTVFGVFASHGAAQAAQEGLELAPQARSWVVETAASEPGSPGA